MPQISPAMRAAVDKMCFMAPFCNKTVFESKVPFKTRKDFHKYIMKRHSHPDALQKFGVAWKAWLDVHQAELSDMDSDAEDSDEEDGDDGQPKRKKKFVSAFGAFGSDNDDDADSTPPASPRAASPRAAQGQAAASPGRAGRRAQATEDE
jgi:hypothetical protein